MSASPQIGSGPAWQDEDIRMTHLHTQRTVLSLREAAAEPAFCELSQIRILLDRDGRPVEQVPLQEVGVARVEPPGGVHAVDVGAQAGGRCLQPRERAGPGAAAPALVGVE
ncbi:MAG: hypothetical protein Q4P32_04450, partial [Micrococcales bacterium]|nr:hypothetical protein [Micrococcales bacterium]